MLRSRLIASVAIVAAVVAAPAAAFADGLLPGLVDVTPRTGTPNISGSTGQRPQVLAIEEADGYVAAGGLFDTYKKPGGSTFAVSNFVVWRDSTSILTSSPTFNGTVNAIEVADDDRSFYVGGSFTAVDGVAQRALVRVDRDGTIDPDFTPDVKWKINDLALVGDRLFVAGYLESINGVPHSGIAVLDPTTGEVLQDAPLFEGAYSSTRSDGSINQQGSTSVDKIDASEDGTRLVASGNFVTVDGFETGRLAQFNISNDRLDVMDWSVPGYRVDECRSWIVQFITDIEVSPSGDYVVVASTGASYGPDGGSHPETYLCDIAARFELSHTGSDVPYTWISPPGGDTTSGVAIDGDVVYIGGHHRWMNNYFKVDRTGPGAVEVDGISAHDARSGLVLSDWTPGRQPRGRGAYEMTITEDGLWVGQDTGTIGNQYRGFVAQMPYLSGVRTLPGLGELPADLVIPRDGGDVVRTVTTIDATVELPFTSGLPASDITGVTAIDGDRITTRDNDSIVRVAADGTATTIDARGLVPNYFDPSKIGSLAYDEELGELLYTYTDQDVLYARAWDHGPGLLSSVERVVTTDSFDWRDVRGMELVGGVLIVVDRDDDTAYASTYDGASLTGTTAISGPGIDGTSWTSDDMYVGATGGVERRNVAPVAAFDLDCDGLACRVDAGDSTDTHGAIDSYAFSTSGPAGAVTLDAAHGLLLLPSAGEVTVTLTVTDEDGATDTTSQTVTLTPHPLTSVGLNEVNKWGDSFTVTVPEGVKDGGFLLLTAAASRAGAIDEVTGLEGWTQVATRTSFVAETRVWWRPVNADEAGEDVTVEMTRLLKAHVAITAFDGVDLADPIAALGVEKGGAAAAAHLSPPVTTDAEAAILELWTMKSSTSADWVEPAGTTILTESHGVNGGHISSLLTTRGVQAPGSYGGSTATADVADTGVTLWTIGLRTQ